MRFFCLFFAALTLTAGAAAHPQKGRSGQSHAKRQSQKGRKAKKKNPSYRKRAATRDYILDRDLVF